jgi:hypothetical protein
MSRRIATVLAVTSMLALAACQSGQDPAVDSGPTTSEAAGSTVPGATTTTIAPGYGTSTVSVPGTKKGLLTAVRAAHHDGFDRVVFEFETSVPGYKVGYITKPVTQDGSGEPIALAGDSALQVRMEPASGVDLDASAPRQTYTGPDRIDPSTPTVTEVARAGDFEAVLTWVIGTKGRPGFSVDTGSNPPTLIIDIASP